MIVFTYYAGFMPSKEMFSLFWRKALSNLLHDLISLIKERERDKRSEERRRRKSLRSRRALVKQSMNKTCEILSIK